VRHGLPTARGCDAIGLVSIPARRRSRKCRQNVRRGARRADTSRRARRSLRGRRAPHARARAGAARHIRQAHNRAARRIQSDEIHLRSRLPLTFREAAAGAIEHGLRLAARKAHRNHRDRATARRLDCRMQRLAVGFFFFVLGSKMSPASSNAPNASGPSSPP